MRHRLSILPTFAFLFSWFLGLDGFGQTAGDYRSGASGDWNFASTWETFNGAVWVSAAQAPQLSDGTITIQAGHVVRLTGSEILDGLIVNGTLRIISGVVLSFPPGSAIDVLRVNGTIENFGSVTVANSSYIRVFGVFMGKDGSQIVNSQANSAFLVFEDGSTYNHQYTTSSGSLPLATWSASSTCAVTGYTSNVTIPDNISQQFGNFSWDTPNSTSGTVVNFNGALTTVQGNLYFRLGTTGPRTLYLGPLGGDLNLSVGGSFTIVYGNIHFVNSAPGSNNQVTIGGDYIQNGGNLVFFQDSNNASIALNLTGNFNKTAGTISSPGIGVSGAFNFSGVGERSYQNNSNTVGVNQPTLTIKSGAILRVLGESVLLGTGPVVFENGSHIKLSSSNVLGAMERNVGTRTISYGTDVIIEYSGSALQYMGTLHPSLAGITTIISNPSGTRLVANSFAINGTVLLSGGNFLLQDKVMVFGGDLNCFLNSVEVSALTDLTISADGIGGTFGPLRTSGGGLKDFVIEDGRVVNMGNDLTIDGTFFQVAGDIQLGGYTLTLRGSYDYTSGVLVGNSNSNLVISGVGTLPNLDVPISGSLESFTMDRSASVFRTSSNLTVNDLLFLQGTLQYSGDMVLLNSMVSNSGCDFVDSRLFVGGNVTISGSEVPTLGELTVNPLASLTLQTSISLSGDFTMDGNLSTNMSAIILAGESIQRISRTTDMSAINFYTLEINKANGAVEILNAVDIINVLGVYSATTVQAGDELIRLISTGTETARVASLHPDAEIVGSVIVQRFLPNPAGVRAYRYITPPVVNSFVLDWKNEVPITGTFPDPSTGPGIVATSPSLFYYDETNTTAGTTLESRYRKYPDAQSSDLAPLINGLGYAIFVRSTGTITLDTRGTLAQHDIDINVTAQSATGNDGWNLIGNPYPSPVYWDSVGLAGGVGTAIYIRDNTNVSGEGGGTFVSYIDGVSVPASFNGVVDAGQAFWVHATSNGSISFTESDKVNDVNVPTQIYRLPSMSRTNSNLLRLSVSGVAGRDETVLRLKSNVTDQFEKEFDAPKYFQTGLNIFSRTEDDKEVVINSFNDDACTKKISIGVTKAKVGDYTIAAEGSIFAERRFLVHLVDSKLGKRLKFDAGTEYTFTLQEADLLDLAFRFYVEIEKYVDVDIPVLSSVICGELDSAKVELSSAQVDVEYAVFKNGMKLTPWIGGSAAVDFVIASQQFESGKNIVSVIGRNGMCATDTLSHLKEILFSYKPVMPISTDRISCNGQGVQLAAFGAVGSEVYAWYDDSEVKIISGGTGLLDLEEVTASSRFKVSILNSDNCESDLLDVVITPIWYDTMTLERVGNTIISNYTIGNSWFFNGVDVDGYEGGKLRVTKTGIYSARQNIEGCITESMIEIKALEPVFNGLKFYPNPVSNEGSFLMFRNYSEDKFTFRIESMSGKLIDSFMKNLDYDLTPLHFDFNHLSPGLYILRCSASSGGEFVLKFIKN